MESKTIKKVVAFDFDDTLAKTKSLIGVRLRDPTGDTKEYLSGVGVSYKSEQGGYLLVDSMNYEILESSCESPHDVFHFDYTQTMNIDLRTAREITFMFKKLQIAYDDPAVLPIIVTARAGVVTEFSPVKQRYVKSQNRPKILRFLEKRGIVIPPKNLHTVGDTYGDTAEAKRNVLNSYLQSLKLDEMIFYDDSERNVIATMELRNSLPTGCRLRVYQVKDGACRLRCSYVGREG